MQERIKAAFDKWLKPLGLLWWEIKIVYYENPSDIIEVFRAIDEDRVLVAKTYADWKYASAKICINVPEFRGRTDNEIERIVVHELMHVLVNEMREGELHHEERVVTTLTKAAFWIEDKS